MPSDEPDWLIWARRIQALAQSGLAFTKDPFDKERYEELRALAADMAQAHSGQPVARLLEVFGQQAGYATPKAEVRAAVFDAEGRILLVRETLDNGRWTLPGGWADVNLSARENAIKEVREESGYEVSADKLAAVWDRSRQGHPSSFFSCYKLFFTCTLLGGEATTSLETSEVGWFAEQAIPQDLSIGRVLPRQIGRMFRHYREPGLPTDFD